MIKQTKTNFTLIELLVVMLLMLHGGAGTALFLSFYAMLVPAPLITGIAASLCVLRRKGNHSLRI